MISAHVQTLKQVPGYNDPDVQFTDNYPGYPIPALPLINHQAFSHEDYNKCFLNESVCIHFIVCNAFVVVLFLFYFVFRDARKQMGHDNILKLARSPVKNPVTLS